MHHESLEIGEYTEVFLLGFDQRMSLVLKASDAQPFEQYENPHSTDAHRVCALDYLTCHYPSSNFTMYQPHTGICALTHLI